MNNPVALITGASRGIGRSIAETLSRSGHHCVLVARNEQALAETAELCSKHPEVSTLCIPADLSDEASPKRIINALLAKYGGLDVLVNNAGCVLSKKVEDTSPGDWDFVMKLNARAPFFLTQAALPTLRQSKTATIINIGSVVSVKGYEKQAVYTASKHALAGWTKTLAKEVAGQGIRVHLITPGGVATEMAKQVRPDIDPDALIRPDEVAEAVQFLVDYRGNAVIDVLDLHRIGKAPFA